MAAKQLLNEALIWKIGNGESVKIWKHKWIPKAFSFRIYTQVSLLDEDALVKELIDPNSQH